MQKRSAISKEGEETRIGAHFSSSSLKDNYDIILQADVFVLIQGDSHKKVHHNAYLYKFGVSNCFDFMYVIFQASFYIKLPTPATF